MGREGGSVCERGRERKGVCVREGGKEACVREGGKEAWVRDTFF